MASLLRLPDELLVRVFRIVREDYEASLLRRAFDAGDIDGAVPMSCALTLVRGKHSLV